MRVVNGKTEIEWNPNGGFVNRLFRGIDRIAFIPAEYDKWEGMADPRYVGIGQVGWHVRLPNGNSRHLESRSIAPLSDGFGYTGRITNFGNKIFAEGGFFVPGVFEPVAKLYQTWRAKETEISCFIRMEFVATEGLQAKEPKVGVALHGVAPNLRVFNEKMQPYERPGKAPDYWSLLKYANPQRKTLQIIVPDRRHLRYFNLGGRKMTTATVTLCEIGSDMNAKGPIFTQWRKHAGFQPHDLAGAPYCHCDPLRGSYEICRYREGWHRLADGEEFTLSENITSILAHGWTGGTGFHDCPCGYRAMPPRGTIYQEYVRVKLGG